MKLAINDFWQRVKPILPYLALVWVLGLVLAVYQSAVRFGFIWDDPVWYGHVVGKTWWQMLVPLGESDFQFFRPLTMIYMWLFLRADGSFAIEALHTFQIGYHLLNTLLAFLIAWHLGLRPSTAVAVAALFALYPFNYQAVAWAAPQQPIAALLQNSTWLLYIWIRPLPHTFSPPTPRRRHLYFTISLILFFVALTIQESSVTVAGIPLLYEFLVRLPVNSWGTFRDTLQTPRASGWIGASTYIIMALIYILVWLVVPRLAGVTEGGLHIENIYYLIQGFVAPVITKISGYEAHDAFNKWGLLLTFAFTVSALLLLARWRKRGRIALFGFIWAIVTVLPFLLGLNFVYVSYSSRLFYISTMGVALLWGCALWPTTRRAEPSWLRLLSIAAVLLICWQSLWVLQKFERLWAEGTAHLNTAVSIMSHPPETTSMRTYLFLNFPDQYTSKREPYPVGYWGIVLTPVVVDVADFLPITTGEKAQSISQAMPWIDLHEREASPFLVDMRGVILEANEMIAVAQNADVVYLTRYGENGSFTLENVGSIQPGSTVATCTAGVLFDNTVCLHNVQVEQSENKLELVTTWSTNAPLPPQSTIFVHYGLEDQPPIAQADGSTWGGAIPLTSWPLNTLIEDRRTILLPSNANASDIPLQIGLYNWVTNKRATAVNTATNQPYPENRVPIWLNK